MSKKIYKSWNLLYSDLEIGKYKNGININRKG